MRAFSMLEALINNAPLCTRDGHHAQLIYHSASGRYPNVYLVRKELTNEDVAMQCDDEGFVVSREFPTCNDLMIADEDNGVAQYI